MKKAFSRPKDIIIFVLPALLLYTVFVLYPLAENIYLSFFKTNLMNEMKFVGLKNYLSLAENDQFWKAMRNCVMWAVICYLVQTVFGLLAGYILYKKVKFGNVFQTIYFMPSVICGTAIGLLFTFVYHPEIGLLNGILKSLGLEEWCHTWLAEDATAPYALVAMSAWQYIGYHMVIMTAGMKNINPELFEAAEIDGASSSQQFWKIMFPLLRNILRIDAVLISTACLKTFDTIAVTTKGGPNHETESLAYMIFRVGFRGLRFGTGSAVAVVLLVMCIVFTVMINQIFKSENYEN